MKIQRNKETVKQQAYSPILPTVVEKAKQVKKGSHRVAGHLVDQQLKYHYPQAKQLPLFETLGKETIQDITSQKVRVETITEGVRLTSAEEDIVFSLRKLLDKNSQTANPQEDSYYSGDEVMFITNSKGEREIAPKLAFNLYELTKEYRGGGSISGKDVQNVKEILQKLSEKRFLIKYKMTSPKLDKRGKKIGYEHREMEDYRKIITIIKVTETDLKGNVQDIGDRDTEVALHPIFRNQIDTKYLIYPDDMIKRTEEAYGGTRVPGAVKTLRDYLLREMSSKRYTPEIYVDRLYYLLAESYMNQSRKKKVKELTDRAIETCTKLGVILSYETVKGSTGEDKIIFTLNKEWE